MDPRLDSCLGRIVKDLALSSKDVGFLGTTEGC